MSGTAALVAVPASWALRRLPLKPPKGKGKKAAEIRRKQQQAASAAVAVSVVVLMPFHAAGGEVLEDIFSRPKTPMEAALREFARRCEHDSALRKAMAGMDQATANTFAMRLAGGGLKTLPDADLEHRARILRRIVDRGDDHLAAGFFTGNLDQAAVQVALQKLSDDDIHAWFELSYKSMLGALKTADPPGIFPNDVEKRAALDALVDAVGADGPRLRQILLRGAGPEAEAAWAARAVYDHLWDLTARDRRFLLRVFVSGA
jgi:hypothetical protein